MGNVLLKHSASIATENDKFVRVDLHFGIMTIMNYIFLIMHGNLVHLKSRCGSSGDLPD
jgi:hypothetical protein